MRTGGGRFFGASRPVGARFVAPSGWREAVANLAYFYRFQPSEIWAMDLAEFMMWTDQARRIHGEIRAAR